MNIVIGCGFFFLLNFNLSQALRTGMKLVHCKTAYHFSQKSLAALLLKGLLHPNYRTHLDFTSSGMKSDR